MKIEYSQFFPKNLKYLSFDNTHDDVLLYDNILDNLSFDNLELLKLRTLSQLSLVYAKKDKLPKLKYLYIEELYEDEIDDKNLLILTRLKIRRPNLLFDFDYIKLLELTDLYHPLIPEGETYNINQIPQKDNIVPNFLQNTRYSELEEIFNLPNLEFTAADAIGFYLTLPTHQFSISEILKSDGHLTNPECSNYIFED